MSTEDRLEGAKNAFTMFFAYFDQVAREIGTDRAVVLTGKADEAMGAMMGRIIKEKAGPGLVDAQKAASLAKKSIKGAFGITFKLKEDNPDKVMIKCGRCPVYEAGLAVGMNNDEIEAMCRVGPIKYMDSMVKELNPDLSYRLRKFRTSSDSPCEEEIVLS